MAPSGRSFAQRVASMASNVTIENWDDDGDLNGDLFSNSISTLPTLSSRVSVQSESNAGDDDWQLLLTPNDENSTATAISTAKQAGIPIPANVPASALLGGTIKRLQTKKSKKKIVLDDDWGEDLELPTQTGPLKLKIPPTPETPADDHDDFDDWGEGSLGIRFGGTRREAPARTSTGSAMSPSINSCMTFESEEDDLGGLVLPTEPVDFNARLNKLKKETFTPDSSPPPALPRRELPPTSVPRNVPDLPAAPVLAPPLNLEPVRAPIPQKLPGTEDEEDFLAGLEIGPGDIVNPMKPTLNKNVVLKKQASKPVMSPAAKPATTLKFTPTDKPSVAAMSRIPRPLSTARTRLAPLYENGASTLNNARPMPTTTSAQLLRAKRSAPALRSNYASVQRPPVPFIPAGAVNSHSHHITGKSSQPQLRRDSDPNRPLSPVALRSNSRMSSTNPETPSRAGLRKDIAPAALVREAAARRAPPPLKPARRKQYGDGSELEIFDDLPTSAAKEKKFEKVPANMHRSSMRSLRQQPSITRMPLPDRMATPVPQTPRSPPRADNTPRFARDTAASRIAREQRLAGTRSRGDGPIAPTQTTNWKAQVAARSPHSSPTALRKKGTGQKPVLIKAMSAPMVAKNEKGMIYNPILRVWEGNEEALAPFTHPNTSTTTIALTTASTPTFAPPNQRHHAHDRSHSLSHHALSAINSAQAARQQISSRAVNIVGPPSPPRGPALISNKCMSTKRGVQVERNMMYDPRRMTWVKAPRNSLSSDPRSPIEPDDEEDPFAGIEDLKEDNDKTSITAGFTGMGGTLAPAAEFDEGSTFISEEFDLGPRFIQSQRREEEIWRRRVEGWVGGIRDDSDSWRWAVRDLAALASAQTANRPRRM